VSRQEVYKDIEGTLGLVPSFIQGLPDEALGPYWEAMKRYQLSETLIPLKYKQLIGLAVSAAIHCPYCTFFHSEAAKLMGVKRVVYASSETVYGPQAMYGDRDVTEDDQTNPTHSYAVCKLFAEIIAGQYSKLYGMSFTGVRPTIGYGHGGRSPAQHWSDMPSAVAVGKPFSMEGDGNGLSSLVSADDLADFTRILIKAPSSPHPVYNVGGPATRPRDMAAVLRKYIPEAKISFGTRPMMDPGGKFGLPWLVSMKQAIQDFGFSCMPLEKAVLLHINDARIEAGLKPLKG